MCFVEWTHKWVLFLLCYQTTKLHKSTSFILSYFVKSRQICLLKKLKLCKNKQICNSLYIIKKKYFSCIQTLLENCGFKNSKVYEKTRVETNPKTYAACKEKKNKTIKSKSTKKSLQACLPCPPSHGQTTCLSTSNPETRFSLIMITYNFQDRTVS